MAQALITYLSISLLALSCGTSEQVSKPSVIRGEPVAFRDWRSTVALTNAKGYFCTGYAYNRNLIITAAHCLVGKKAENIKIFVGKGHYFPAVQGTYAVSRIAVSPLYKNGKDHDFGYLLLKKPLDLHPLDYIPLLTNPKEEAELLRVGAKATIVGYGITEYGYEGEKHAAETYVSDGKDYKYSYNKKTEIAIGRFGVDTCQGDSGGPVFGKLKNGELRVYALTSRGGPCGTASGIYSLLKANYCWLQKDSEVELFLPRNYCALRP